MNVSLQNQGRRKVKEVLVGAGKWEAQPSRLIKNYIKLVGELWISISNEVIRKWAPLCDLATHIIICPFLTFSFWKIMSALFFRVHPFVYVCRLIFLWFMQSKGHRVCTWEEKGCADIIYLTEKTWIFQTESHNKEENTTTKLSSDDRFSYADAG